MSHTADHDQCLALLDAHKGVLHKVANTYCPRAEDRNDLIQEMSLQVWRSYPRFDGRCKFSTWMYRIALNVAISFHRQESAHQQVPHLLFTGLLMHACGLAMILFGVRVQVLIHRIDFGAPVLSIQKQLAELRRFYVVGEMCLGLPWWLLWIPCVTTLFMGRFDVDLYMKVPQVITLNVAVGVVGLILTWLFLRWSQGRPKLAEKLEDATAGTSLNKALRMLDEIARFERE